jgi:hypothetical protein
MFASCLMILYAVVQVELIHLGIAMIMEDYNAISVTPIDILFPEFCTCQSLQRLVCLVLQDRPGVVRQRSQTQDNSDWTAPPGAPRSPRGVLAHGGHDSLDACPANQTDRTHHPYENGTADRPSGTAIRTLQRRLAPVTRTTTHI